MDPLAARYFSCISIVDLGVAARTDVGVSIHCGPLLIHLLAVVRYGR